MRNLVLFFCVLIASMSTASYADSCGSNSVTVVNNSQYPLTITLGYLRSDDDSTKSAPGSAICMSQRSGKKINVNIVYFQNQIAYASPLFRLKKTQTLVIDDVKIAKYTPYALKVTYHIN